MRRRDFEEFVRRLSTATDSRGNRLAVDAVGISIGGRDFSQCITSQGRQPHAVRSISKLVVALCLGIAIEATRLAVGKRRLCLDTLVWTILRDRVELRESVNTDRLEKITVRHLLTQTTGFSSPELMLHNWMQQRDPDRLLDALFNEPIAEEPGTAFVYSNASAFILSALFQEFSGESLYSAAQRELFRPMGVLDHHWLNYGKYTAGATGLYLLPEDLHKLGKLMLQRGHWQGKQLVPEWFVDLMVSKNVDIGEGPWRGHPLSPRGYGFLVWINDLGYYASGAMGQYLIVQPGRQAVVSVSANQEETSQLLECITGALAVVG